MDGMDELSNTARNSMLILKSGNIERHELDPKLLDLKVVKRPDSSKIKRGFCKDYITNNIWKIY